MGWRFAQHPGPLREVEHQAEYIAAVCEAGSKAGVHVVVNARIDLYVRQSVPAEARVAETLRRGRQYLKAGATCVYPIGVTDPQHIAALVEHMGGPINVWLRPDSPTLADLHRLRVARVSLAATLQRQAMTHATSLATALLNDEDDSMHRTFAVCPANSDSVPYPTSCPVCGAWRILSPPK